MKNNLIKELFPLKNEIIFVYNIIKKYQFDKSFEWGPCHLDMKPENCLVKNNKIKIFLDFDNCEYNALILDIGRTLKWWCYDEKGYSKKKSFYFFK